MQKSIKILPSNISNYTIIIPKEVERMIRFLCKKISTVEWSGILFYTYEGNFKDDNLKILCKNICLMDIGTSGYTEFENSPEIISYMVNNDLIGCQLGLIHSHNNMATFFSGTDQNTLIEKGTDRNNFVSLIVNNKGTYTAAITRKILSSTTNTSIKFEFFGEGEVEEVKEITNNDPFLEAYYLKVIKEEEEINYPEFENRISEIKTRKEEEARKITNNKSIIVKGESNKVNSRLPINKNNISFLIEDRFQKVLKEDSNIMEDITLDPAWKFTGDSLNSGIKADKDLVEELTFKLLVGSVFFKYPPKESLEEIVNKMVPTYKEKFEGEIGKSEGIDGFTYWAESMVDYIITSITIPELEANGFIDLEIQSAYAQSIVDILKVLPNNIYIEKFIELLNNFII